MTIKKLLISNRGEIASRIIKSAHDMGITCVAIYTEADKNTPYVREADQSFKLSDSYLNAKEILEEPSIENLLIIEALGSNWYNAQGIGLFFDAGNGWIYHIEMGWSFLKICKDQTSFWMFHEKLGWFWINQGMPNMLYLSNESTQGWHYFPQNTLAESKYIYGYENTTWYHWNQ